AKVIKEKIDALRQKLANREGLTAAVVREEVGALQQQSLKLFEAAYKKMAEKNAGAQQGGDQQQQQPGGDEQKKEEQK
ncbi:Heat shock protein 70 F, partial [Aphelenchoides avenae]